MKLSEYIAAWEDGKIVEAAGAGFTQWTQIESAQAVLTLWEDLDVELRIRPKLKTVDMSALVGSGVDCWFSSNGDNCRLTDQLLLVKELDAGGVLYQAFESCGLHLCCKPRMNYWFSTKNFDDYEVLEQRLIDAGFQLDIHGDSFAITGIQSDRCWPWECNNPD